MTNNELAQKLDALAESRKSAPDDYFGSRFWRQDDVQLLKDSAAALRSSALKSPVDQKVVEDQLAEDRRIYGNAFYTIVDGRKMRIPPQELFIDVAEPRKVSQP